MTQLRCLLRNLCKRKCYEFSNMSGCRMNGSWRPNRLSKLQTRAFILGIFTHQVSTSYFQFLGRSVRFLRHPQNNASPVVPRPRPAPTGSKGKVNAGFMSCGWLGKCQYFDGKTQGDSCWGFYGKALRHKDTGWLKGKGKTKPILSWVCHLVWARESHFEGPPPLGVLAPSNRMALGLNLDDNNPER